MGSEFNKPDTTIPATPEEIAFAIDQLKKVNILQEVYVTVRRMEFELNQYKGQTSFSAKEMSLLKLMFIKLIDDTPDFSYYKPEDWSDEQWQAFKDKFNYA